LARLALPAIGHIFQLNMGVAQRNPHGKMQAQECASFWARHGQIAASVVCQALVCI
jgi:hypothetical protein